MGGSRGSGPSDSPPPWGLELLKRTLTDAPWWQPKAGCSAAAERRQVAERRERGEGEGEGEEEGEEEVVAGGGERYLRGVQGLDPLQ